MAINLTSQNNLFGLDQNKDKPNTTNQSIFSNAGNNNPINTPNPTTNNLFSIGTTKQPTNEGSNNISNLFGNPTLTNQPSNNIFGLSSTTTPNPTSVTNQPQTQTQPQQQQGTNIFGNLTTTTKPKEETSIFSTLNTSTTNTTTTNTTTVNQLQSQAPQQQQSTPLFGNINPQDNNKKDTQTTNQTTNSTLFSSLATNQQKPTETAKSNQPSSTSANLPSTQQQQDSSKARLSIQNPEASPNEITQLDQLAYESFFRMTVEEGFTQWKNELGFQMQKMDTLTKNFKALDGQIEHNFESIKNMIMYRQRLQNDSDKSLAELKDIILEEDQVLEHLNYLDNTLGNYLEEIDKTNLRAKHQDKESILYNSIIEVSKSVNAIESEIKEANAKVSCNQIEDKPKEDAMSSAMMNKNTSIIYENEQLHEKLPIEKSEMDYILNSFYVSIRAIQSMQNDLSGKIGHIEREINEMHKERLNLNSNYTQYDNDNNY